jgi:hypothetical protein
LAKDGQVWPPVLAWFGPTVLKHFYQLFHFRIRCVSSNNVIKIKKERISFDKVIIKSLKFIQADPRNWLAL